jgi:hypothetical protein
MKATWTFHRFVRAESRWIDTPDAEADATAGVLGPARTEREPELEATLAIDESLVIRDTLWPLAWRLCLEPIPALLVDAKGEWVYRCFAQAVSYTLRLDGEVVHVRKNQEPERPFPTRELLTALFAAGAHVTALAERDRGPDGENVGFLRPARDAAEMALRSRGWL